MVWMVPIFAVGLSWTLILDQLFANNHKSSAGMLKSCNQPTSVLWNVQFVALICVSAPEPAAAAQRGGDQELVLNAGCSGLALPACVLSVVVSLLHY